MSDDFDFEDPGWIEYLLAELHQHATAAGSQWDITDNSTTDIPVNAKNADMIYGLCRELRELGKHYIPRQQMKKIKVARAEAHQFLHTEANDPATSIERKIALVKLTSKFSSP